MIGQTLSHYKITSKLGEGGMGEVYRATDTKLNRDVALKVLPEAFAADRERMARFSREAQVLASLNHPNIASIYGLEDSEDKHALVLELVEGETLAERIQKGAIPLEESLKIALQMAEALEAAHEKGIIHRDLKPANVKITPEGKVKVLDFGLAKALEDEIPAADLTHSPTRTDQMTNVGVIMGTAGYMSPEQARGQAVDKRTDIWAFGCVLYEVLTRKQVFGGHTMTDILGAIVHKEPDWEALPERTPQGIPKLLHRCLEKDPHDRLHHIADARIEIVHATQEPLEAPSPAQPAAATWSWIILGAGITALLASGVITWSFWQDPAPAPVKRLTLNLPSDYDPRTPGGYRMVVSPSGQDLVYLGWDKGVGRIYHRRLDQTETRALAGTEGASRPFVSPDGKWVGFQADDQLKRVPLAGGTPQVICDVTDLHVLGATWGPDGDIIFGTKGPGGLYQVSAQGGTPHNITTPNEKENEREHTFPQFLPGGKAVVFDVRTGGGATSGTPLGILSLETGKWRKVLQGGYPIYSPSGHLLYKASTFPMVNMAVRFDVDRLEVTGEPVRLGTLEGINDFVVLPDGTLIYFQPPQSSDPVWVDRQGHVEPLTTPSRVASVPRLSPDGHHLALNLGGLGAREIWTLEIARGILSPLVQEPSGGPVWTPDGKELTFSLKIRPGLRTLFQTSADGSGEPAQLIPDREPGRVSHLPCSWSPDGKVLAYIHRTSPVSHDIWLLPLGAKPEPFLATPAQEIQPAFSPNGRWLAFTSDRSGRNEVYIAPYPGGEAMEQISPAGGSEPMWARESGELFYRSEDKVMVVTIETNPSLQVGAPRLLFEGSYARAVFAISPANYDVTPDGQRFVMVPEKRILNQLQVIVNWFEELKRLVPKGN